MTQLTPAQVKSALLAFLTAQYEKKTETERKQLEKAESSQDLAKISELKTKLAEIQQKYRFADWLEDAATRMAKQLKFGTHISKGVHPDAKGDNVNFQTDHTLPKGLIGSQTITSQLLDANGNAAALPLAAFFDIALDDSGTKLRTLIMQDSPALTGVFADDEVRSAEYQRLFKKALISELSKPATHERNKQLLFPVGAQYHCIVPLYPSVFTHELYQRIIQLRFSEANKTARENRFKKNVEQKAYLSIPNTAVTILGGTKPQNVSQLMSKQGGRNYLLPSLPPHFKQEHQFSIGHTTSTIFSKNLIYLCRGPLQQLFKIVRTDYNNVHIRKARKDCLDNILFRLISAARDIQLNRAAGWSKEANNLNHAEKLWLDPNRTLLDDEEAFKAEREKGDWRDQITRRFADWLQAVLKKEFSHIKQDFADAEHREWRRELEEMIKESLRVGQEVFA
ncbi:type I-F CRISPR-associated protein Csy1 [Pasteurella testudinis]|uniref:type I-F CRISPR-associated protein Csy1 n=1 Tax=Pasteurella testudinis TaxID=761 RepID=UPI0040595F3C